MGIGALDEERDALDPGFIALLVIHDRVGEPAAFHPAGVHAVEHEGPVATLGAAGPGLDAEVAIAGVEVFLEEAAQLQFLHHRERSGERLQDFVAAGGVFFGLADLDEDGEVFEAGFHFVPRLHDVLELLHLDVDAFEFLEVVVDLRVALAKAQIGELLAELVDVQRVHVFGHPVEEGGGFLGLFFVHGWWKL
jgi:hypothetical protein